MLINRQLTVRVGLEKVCFLLTWLVLPRVLAGASRIPPSVARRSPHSAVLCWGPGCLALTDRREPRQLRSLGVEEMPLVGCSPRVQIHI